MFVYTYIYIYVYIYIYIYVYIYIYIGFRVNPLRWIGFRRKLNGTTGHRRLGTHRPQVLWVTARIKSEERSCCSDSYFRR